ncbi:hypothetical protein F4780DRAFT_795532 [Xylariomycetidae sp. FL0641]|nr:hypothetical protein F4780DRAFT_795532 [Xylariomycetidae sp. FL0641]
MPYKYAVDTPALLTESPDCDDEVPIQTEHVARYEYRWEAQARKPKSNAWVVKSKVAKYVNFKIWMRPGFSNELQKAYPKAPDISQLRHRGSFVNGKAMTHIKLPIHTVGGKDRPRILHRVVHDRQPHYGEKTRGYGLVEIDELRFSMLVQKHLDWRCRHRSPFISVTDRQRKVNQVAELIIERGGTGVRIITFRSSGPGWDHQRQRLWRVWELARELGYSAFGDKLFESEYLLEDEIPPESIIEVIPVVTYRDKPEQSSVDPRTAAAYLVPRKIKLQGSPDEDQADVESKGEESDEVEGEDGETDHDEDNEDGINEDDINEAQVDGITSRSSPNHDDNSHTRDTVDHSTSSSQAQQGSEKITEADGTESRREGAGRVVQNTGGGTPSKETTEKTAEPEQKRPAKKQRVYGIRATGFRPIPTPESSAGG